MPSRLGHAALLTTSLIVGTGVASLLATEPALPPRTQLAFAAIVLIAAGWVIYSTWVLTRRRVLLGRQRVTAARMACVFAVLGLAGSIAVRNSIGLAGVWSSAALFIVAVALLIGAHRHVHKLTRLMQEAGR